METKSEWKETPRCIISYWKFPDFSLTKLMPTGMLKEQTTPPTEKKTLVCLFNSAILNKIYSPYSSSASEKKMALK